MDPVSYNAALQNLAAMPRPPAPAKEKLGVIELHQQVLAAILKGNPEAARQLVVDHPALSASYLATRAGIDRLIQVVVAQLVQRQSEMQVVAAVLATSPTPRFMAGDIQAIAVHVIRNKDGVALASLMAAGVPMESSLGVFLAVPAADLIEIFATAQPARTEAQLVQHIQSNGISNLLEIALSCPTNAFGHLVNKVLSCPGPGSAAPAIDPHARLVNWWNIAQHDNPALMNRIIALGWMPDIEDKMTGIPADWCLPSIGAFTLFSLWMSEPALRAAALSRAAGAPHLIAPLVTESKSPTKMLEAMRGVGFDFLAKDPDGKNVAYRVAESHNLPAIRWLARNVPEALDAQIPDGTSGWGVVRGFEEGEILVLKYQGKRLEKSIPAADPGSVRRM